MNEEKRPNFPDKYHLSRKESGYLLKKNIVELVYNAGKFEGLNTTLLQTEEIIKYNRANDVAVDDVLTVVNLKRGFELLLNDVQEPLLETSKRINRIVAAEDALFPGEIRTGGVEVSTIQGRYVPPMLTEDEVKNQYSEIMNQDISESEKALRLFLFISKNQIFWDGNKRTALLTANKIMFSRGLGLLSIPETVFTKFNELLSMYCNSNQSGDELRILTFMYEECIFGITYKS
ncbi:Fic family protein [Listeria monocytogenes]|jgi:prophage maintenance system killer protein|uniref:Fic family protein n=1 Tax=Listeria monocytogenes TaxID=1639 RepID=A0A457DCX9_LISMN|nr:MULTISPECIES: Fic family protein [Bacilli]EKK7202359.1 Fic family protein [Listeria innocua]EAA0070090.1 Fic family protein [Listeria monocytogenes]EAC2427623.1 Fic family protein [Listeria monocytogenes]EAC2445807.1 Fic family protein [Listeria monocytogenes]EAC2518864.1 Fic family protein [Listeria monocytogenes]